MANATLANTDETATNEPEARRALFIDLDGTLIEGDLLRSACRKVLTRPGLWPRCIVWLLRGRAYLKYRLSREIIYDAAGLRYRSAVLDLIHRRKDAGDRLVLASATARSWADAVADHLGCFDDVLASSAAENLKGPRKLAAIEDYCRAHRIERFGYVGDSLADLAIWIAADDVYLVAGRLGVLARFALGRPYVVVGSDELSSPTAAR